MIFRRKGVLVNAFILTLLLASSNGQSDSQSNSRSYDTNDWIPVSRPATPSEGSQKEPTQKRPTGRVLNLSSQNEKRYFQDEPISSNSQYRLPSDDIRTDQPQLLKGQGQYQPQQTHIQNGQQQILLPPQLQSLISQGQSYISPQNINQQLLQTQIHDYSALPTQNFSLNSTNFNSKDVIQNINIGLYNQNPSKQQVSQQITQREQPEVQLLYVPLENLQRQRGQRQQVIFPTEQAVPASQVYNSPTKQQYQSSVPHKQVQLQNIEQDFVQQALHAQKLQEQFQHNFQRPHPQQNYRKPVIEEISQQQTTRAPTKRKPHQPPLAVYMGTEGLQEIKIGDVLSLLKDAKTISVQDTVGPDSPQVFVGPSHLEAPEGYAKFDLPYLSSIENNRVERKVDQLPFFVAPLSYKAPPGYSKIPFPAPHVGSVVIKYLKTTPSTTTEHINYGHSQTLEDTSSHIPLSQPEISTIRTTRGRQRQSSLNNYSVTTDTTVPDNIPYGPLPTKVTPELQQLHSVQESLISPNPYGPTRFIQTTTPAIYDKPVHLPEEFFSTSNRFSTSSYNNENGNSPKKHNIRPEVVPTESTVASSTLSATLINDKYTVLEQFPIGQKQMVEKNVSHRGSDKQNIRRPTPETYQIDSTEKTVLPLISSVHNINQHEFKTQAPFKQQYIQQEIPTRQKNVESYEEIPSKRTNTEPTKESITDAFQEIPSRQRVTENYQHFIQNSPAQQILLREQFPTQESHHKYESPVHHATQISQISGQQQLLSENSDRHRPSNYQTQISSQAQTQKTRGKQHFTPDAYFEEEYDQYIKEKSTESLGTVTKEPAFKYNVLSEQTHHVPVIRNQHQQHLIQDTYYQHEPQQDVIPTKQEYTLPAKLPPISPQLPGLINSLQDQQIRPLLAPLLIPPSEQTSIVELKQDSQEEYNSFPELEPESKLESIHTPVTTTTTTPAPTTVTTTQYKRTRSRLRGTRPTDSYDYVSTTATPRKLTSYRGRRPNSGQLKQEYKPRENYSDSPTAYPEVITESVIGATINRNRHIPQRQYVSSTTEFRRTPSSSRQRFRTRGRPVTSEKEYIERSTPRNVSILKKPVLEGGFQASPQQNVQLIAPNIGDELAERQNLQKEQALIYIQNTVKPTAQEANPVPDAYIPWQQHFSSTETLESMHRSSVAAISTESNFDPDVVHEQPTDLSTQQHIKNSNAEDTNFNSQADFNSQEESNVQVPQTNTNSELEIKQESSTEFNQSRTRTRNKTRGRISSARYQPSYSSTTTHRTTTNGKQEEGEEFYGFFRQPNFGKLPQPVKPRTESSPSPSERPNIAYSSKSTDEPQQKRFYVNSENQPVHSSPKPYLPVTHIADSYVQPNIQVHRQYIASTNTPSVSSLEEPVLDIKPIIRRPTSRIRRPPTSTTKTDNFPSAVSVQSNEKYHIRSTKRPEVQTTRTTRIRGRVRPSTSQFIATHSSRSNEFNNNNNNSEEQVTPVKIRQRVTSRGKSHFQSTKNEKETQEPEEENYPVSFLHGHGIQKQSSPSTVSDSIASVSTPQSVVLTTPSSISARPPFQLTIEPEDMAEDYSDQVPYSSVNQQSVVSKDLEQGVEESKLSAKFVQKPNNFNYIISDEKPNLTTAKSIENETVSSITKEKLIKEEVEDSSQSAVFKTEETVQLTEATTTELPTTTELVTDKPKSRRRGVWRLVKTRPIGDDFESAESQNFQSVFKDNDLILPEKPIKKYQIVKRVRTTTEPVDYETTTGNILDTTSNPQYDIITHKFEETPSTESSVFAPLYQMFGYDSEKYLTKENPEINNQFDITTTENPTMFNTLPDEVEVTTVVIDNATKFPTSKSEDAVKTYSDMMQYNGTLQSDESWKSKVIGTSTTTEISHETEICYRGRCIKSTSTEENNEEKL